MRDVYCRSWTSEVRDVENGHERHRRTRVGLQDKQVWRECSSYETEDDVEKLCDAYIHKKICQ
jgi:hypothetical protein